MTLEELFEDHHAGLFRFVSRMTGDADFAKDIVQETFLTVAGRASSKGSPSKAELYQLARNLTRSGLRKRSRRLGLLRTRSHHVPRAAPEPSPEIGAERAEARAAVRVALAELSEKERTIVLMREEGFRHREIADAVGTTTGSVGTMLARALDKLEARLCDIAREEP